MADFEDRNITPEAVEADYSEKKKKGFSGNFSEKNYLSVKLDPKTDEKSLKIRLLTVDKDTNSPFKHIHMHTVRVPKEISQSGWKSYVCLEKTEGGFSETLGHKCPFCELRRDAFKKAQEAKEAGNEADYERYKAISIANIPNEVSIVRCIERGKEEDGPKFWKFNLRSDGLDPENIIRRLYATRKEECEEEGIPVENILDIDKGYDLKVKINAVYDKNGKRTNKTSTSIERFGSLKPLTPDKEQRNKWIGDPKVWSDVFVAKPYEYLEVIIAGGIPWFDRKTNKWIPKEHFEKNTGVNPSDVDIDNAQIEEARRNAIGNQVSNNENKDGNDDLPF